MKIDGAVCAVSVCSESSAVITSTNAEQVFLILASKSRRKYQRIYCLHFPRLALTHEFAFRGYKNLY